MDGDTVFGTVVICVIIVISVLALMALGSDIGEDEVARMWCAEKGYSNGEFISQLDTLHCYNIDVEIGNIQGK